MDGFSKLKLNKNEPVYLQMIKHAKKQILSGEWANGERLPSRRETAATLCINPNTVQKAYKLMEEEGFVITDGNQGSIIVINEGRLQDFKKELTADRLATVLKELKDLNLSFKQVVDMVSELWESRE